MPKEMKGVDLNRREAEILSAHATLSNSGVRLFREDRLTVDYRPTFSVDVDRILHSHAYTRYIDKTKVFYLIQFQL